VRLEARAGHGRRLAGEARANSAAAASSVSRSVTARTTAWSVAVAPIARK
jgi:hypothetical protein